MKHKVLRKLIIVGAGLHFRERHFKVLEEVKDTHGISLELVIDLECEKEKILKYFSNKSLTPKKYLFLPENNRNQISVESLDYLVGSKLNLLNIDGVLICTEPKAHKAYALWAMKHGLDIFCDKPLTAFTSYKEMDSLYNDYLEIKSSMVTNNINFVLCCERRGHLGYDFIMKYAAGMIAKFKVPITFIDIHHGGGLWHMPDEYFLRENHPYKYGYGLILHSGYHYIDLLMNLINLNKPVAQLLAAESDIHVFATTPHNSLNVIQKETYVNIFNTNRFDEYFSARSINKMKYFGETNVLVSGRFLKQNEVITNFSLNLLESSISTRNWDVLPENTYLENGRVHQENVIIHIGPLCSIQLNINPFKALSPKEHHIEDFTVHIMNNSKIVDQEPVVHLTRADMSNIYPDLLPNESLNIRSRRWQLLEFLSGRDGNSKLESHADSIQFLDKIYREIQKQIVARTSETLANEFA